MPNGNEGLDSRNKNPVQGPLPPSRISRDVETMRNSATGFKAEVISEAAKLSKEQQPSDAELNAVQDRDINAGFILEEIESASTSKSTAKVAFKYEFNNVAVGLMLVEQAEKSLHLSYIVTDALSAGAGGALMEAAVRYSESIGKSGVVTLTAIGPAAEAAYLKLGFTKDNENLPPGFGSLTLNPVGSNVWSLVDGKWTISARAAQNYAVGF